MAMSKNINVAIIGLGNVGNSILDKLINYNDDGISMVCVVEQNSEAEGIKLAKSKGISVFQNANAIIELGDKIDVVFDFTDNLEARSDFVMAMAKSRNSHTAIVPPLLAHFVWNLLEKVN